MLGARVLGVGTMRGSWEPEVRVYEPRNGKQGDDGVCLCQRFLARWVLVEKRKMRTRSIGIPLKGISKPIFSGGFARIYPVKNSVSAASYVI